MFRLSIRQFTLAAAMVALAATFFFHPLKPAYACSCMMAPPPQEALGQSQTVFAGTVSGVQPGKDGVLVTFDVDQFWKGPDGPQLTLHTPASSASCGYEFVPGEEYLVYGFAQDGQLSTGLCTRTAPLANAADDLAALGAGTPVSAAPAEAPAPAVEPPAGAPLLPIAIGGAAVVAVAAVAAVALRRRGA